MYRTDLLAGKSILVTGGGTGLGASMAQRFASLGARLWLCGRRAEVLDATAQALRAGTGARVDTLVCDLREAAQVEAMMARIWADGPLDVLVNNAAATFVAQTERLSPRAVDAILAPTLHGAVYCTLEAGRRWIDAGRRGTVLSILSTSTITGRAFTVPSAIAKSGVLAMTRSLAVEWGPKGIRLVAIAPGPFPTAATGTQLGVRAQAGPVGAATPDAGPAASAASDSGPGPVRESAADRNPTGRVGEHLELANLACYLVSDEAAYVNGEMVTIDGGAHLRTSGAEDLLRWRDEDWAAQRAARTR